MKLAIRIALIILAATHVAFAASHPKKAQADGKPSWTKSSPHGKANSPVPIKVSQNERLADHNGKLLILDDHGTVWETDKLKTRDTFTGKKIPLPRYIIARPKKNRVTSINSNGRTVFVTDGNGTLSGWGASEKGELLLTGAEKTDIPEKAAVRILTNVKRMIASGSTLFAIKTDNTLWVWGEPDRSIRGDPHYAPLNRPRKILDHVIDAVNSENHVLVLKEDGTLWTWGSNDCGGLGNSHTKDSITRPVPIDMKPFKGKRIISMTAWKNESYVLTEDSKLWYWGNSTFDQPACFNETFYEPTAISVKPDPRLTRVIYSSGELFAFGRDNTLYSLMHFEHAKKVVLKPVSTHVRQYLTNYDAITVMHKDGIVWIQNDPDDNTGRAQIIFIPKKTD